MHSLSTFNKFRALRRLTLVNNEFLGCHMLKEIQDSVAITHDMLCGRNYQKGYTTSVNRDTTDQSNDIFTPDLKQNASVNMITTENMDSVIEKTMKTTTKMTFEGVDFIQTSNENIQYNDILINTHGYKTRTRAEDYTPEITTDNIDYTYNIIMKNMDYTHMTLNDTFDYKPCETEKNIVIIIISSLFTVISSVYIACLIGIYIYWRKYRNYTSNSGIYYKY
jgi:hypothetical protein